MATCPHADRVIPLLHDNELQNPLRRELVAHMATCVTCARTFSFLEREQELLNQAVEECVDAIDFSGFWQAVEVQLADPPLSWAARLRLWYESRRPAFLFPRPVWAVATLLLVSLGLTYVYRNEALLTIASLLNLSAPKSPTQQESVPDTSAIQQVRDDEAEIESLYSSGSGEVVIHVRRDRANNLTVISLSESASEYPQ